MEKFIFPIFHGKGGGARSNNHKTPLLHYFILHLSLKMEERRIGYFSLLPIDKERHAYDIENWYFSRIHTYILFTFYLRPLSAILVLNVK
jgi:hypothetical protein